MYRSCVPQAPITSSREFYLWDEPQTLFPMSTSRILIDTATASIEAYLRKVVDPSEPAHSFPPQLRVHAAKARHHTRRTMKLDPVAEYFIYDFVYRGRGNFRRPFSATRAHHGYRFEGGAPIDGVDDYSSFKASVTNQKAAHAQSLSFDISAYFNSVYHHDLVHWCIGLGLPQPEVEAFSQFLREINAGRSIDCLPQGLYPCKMIGNSFLSFVDTSNRLKSAATVRLMDDTHLFDNSEEILLADFQRIQFLLGEKGLSPNPSKTVLPSEARKTVSETVDELKLSLLKKRREVQKRYVDGTDLTGHPELQLDRRQKSYLLELLKTDALTEEDAELVLALMQDHGDDLLAHLPVLAAGFPNLAKRFYQFCQRLGRKLSNREQLAEVLLTLLTNSACLTEFQLFWFAKITEDHLLQTKQAGSILIKIFEYEHSTMLTKARILEIPENRFGMVELRESNLKNGSSNWLAWAAATGSRALPRAQRNYALAYFAKASPLNFLVHACISALP